MNKKYLFLITVLILTSMLFSFSVDAMAVENASGVEITTDKESYKSGEEINLKVSVDNVKNFELENLQVIGFLPDGLKVVGDNEIKIEKELLKPQENINKSFTLIKGNTNNSPKTGDLNSIICISLVLIISLVLLIVVIKGNKKKLSLFLSIILLVTLGSNISAKASNDVASKEFWVNKDIIIDDVSYEFKVKVNYEYNSELAKPKISVDVLKLQYDESKDLYYSDKILFSLKGVLQNDANISEFKYEVLDSKNNIIKSGPIEAKKEWTIKDFGLIIGENTLIITAKDEDGLTDTKKITITNSNLMNMYNLDLDKADDDNDGLMNYLEDCYDTDKNITDTDGDGLSDYYETCILITNPLEKDSDKNGINDGQEDVDKDNLTNAEEFKYGTKPNAEDTDKDGLSDEEEINKFKTNPLISDMDTDDVNDALELELGTNPFIADKTFNRTLTYKDSSRKTIPKIIVNNITGKEATSLKIKEIDSNNPLLSMKMPGYIDCGYEVSIDNKNVDATLSFEFDENLINDNNFMPAIYSYNEDKGLLEELENQVIEGNSVKTKVSHFSKFILLNKLEFDKVWEQEVSKTSENSIIDSNNDGISDYYTQLICDGKLRIGSGIDVFNGISYEELQGNDDYDKDGIKNGQEIILSESENKVYLKMQSDPAKEDSDKDGFKDSIDTTALNPVYFADFKSYKQYKYGSSTTLTVFVNQPDENSRNIVDFFDNNDVGHSYLGIDSGLDYKEYAGFSGYATNELGEEEPFGLVRVFRGISVTGRIRMENSYYTATKDSESTELTENVDYKESNGKWDVAHVYKVDDSKIGTLKEFSSKYNHEYNLMSRNCVNFAVEALEALGEDSKIFKHKWSYDGWDGIKVMTYTGYSPADAGEDIRENQSEYLTKVLVDCVDGSKIEGIQLIE